MEAWDAKKGMNECEFLGEMEKKWSIRFFPPQFANGKLFEQLAHLLEGLSPLVIVFLSLLLAEYLSILSFLDPVVTTQTVNWH